jgi:hypothetical protein
MSDIFIAHVEEDAIAALEIAVELEKNGYSIWSYEVSSLPGISYITQSRNAIEETRVIILLISSDSVSSRQVDREVTRGHENGKVFIPILQGITHSEFQKLQPDWADILGTAASMTIPPEGVTSMLPDILAGLKTLGIAPGHQPDKARIKRLQRKLEEQPGYTVPEKPVEEPPRVEKAPEKTAEDVRKPAGWSRKRIALVSASVIIVIAVASVIGYLNLRENPDKTTDDALVTTPPAETIPAPEPEPAAPGPEPSAPEPSAPEPEPTSTEPEPSPVIPTSPQELARYFHFSYDTIDIDKDEIHGNEEFTAIITGNVTCSEDLNLSDIKLALTCQISAEHATSGAILILNPGYEVDIEHFPSNKGETATTTQPVTLQFPVGAESGDYDIYWDIIEAKADIGVWLDITDYFQSTQDLGSVKYIAS